VTAVRALTPDVREADLAMIEPPALEFEAGQWVSVPFGPKTVRAYSIASTPLTPSTITLCADLAPGRIGSRWFRGLAPGAEVAFKGPLGGFVLGAEETRRPLFVAEEIGIVPIRAMLTQRQAKGGGRPATLVLWARDPSWLVYHAELQALARGVAGLAYHAVVRDAGPDWGGERGEVAPLVARLVDAVDDLVAYVAGGGTMINDVRAVLMAKGLSRKSVKWEKFW
jgi:ferredoxin-NADP reductase